MPSISPAAPAPRPLPRSRVPHLDLALGTLAKSGSPRPALACTTSTSLRPPTPPFSRTTASATPSGASSVFPHSPRSFESPRARPPRPQGFQSSTILPRRRWAPPHSRRGPWLQRPPSGPARPLACMLLCHLPLELILHLLLLRLPFLARPARAGLSLSRSSKRCLWTPPTSPPSLQRRLPWLGSGPSPPSTPALRTSPSAPKAPRTTTWSAFIVRTISPWLPSSILSSRSRGTGGKTTLTAPLALTTSSPRTSRLQCLPRRARCLLRRRPPTSLPCPSPLPSPSLSAEVRPLSGGASTAVLPGTSLAGVGPVTSATCVLPPKRTDS